MPSATTIPEGDTSPRPEVLPLSERDSGASPESTENPSRQHRRSRQLHEELAVRAAISLLILAFNEIVTGTTAAGSRPLIRVAALLNFLLGGPYYLLARSGRWLRAQAYGRMLVDMSLITLGVYGAGGLAAAPYLGVYAVPIVYIGIVFSGQACMVATAFAIASYLGIALLQEAHWLAAVVAPAGTWTIVAFNLLVLGMVGGLTATFSEAYRRSRRRVRDSEARLRAVADSVPDAIVATDERGGIISWTKGAQAMFGYSEGEALGRPFAMLLPEPSRRIHEDAVRRILSAGESRVIGTTEELRGLRQDGGEFPIELALARWRTLEGAFLSTIVRNTSERKHLEEQLRQSQKMEAVGRLAGGVAHDFNNLLAVILGRAELLLARLRPDEPLRRDAGLIQETAVRAAALTRQLLAFSRRQMLQPRVLSLNHVVADIEPMLRRLIGEDIDVVTVLDPALGRARVDQGQIEQVIMNLAVNARDAMIEGGKLTIETLNVELDESSYARWHFAVRPGGYVMLAVTDTGIGMDESMQGRIFEPFFTTKEQGKGTGLGLATVYGIVKQSGGYIWVYSEPGQGTTFKIYLPRVQEPATEPAEPHAAPARPLRGSETVLLVEDEAPVRDLMREILERNGYAVLEAGRGSTALELSERRRGPIDLLVTDVVMPEMSGRELADRLAPLRPEMKVLYISGYTDDAIVRHRVFGAETAFLQKPFTEEVLLRTARDVLERVPEPAVTPRSGSREGESASQD